MEEDRMLTDTELAEFSTQINEIKQMVVGHLTESNRRHEEFMAQIRSIFEIQNRAIGGHSPSSGHVSDHSQSTAISSSDCSFGTRSASAMHGSLWCWSPSSPTVSAAGAASPLFGTSVPAPVPASTELSAGSSLGLCSGANLFSKSSVAMSDVAATSTLVSKTLQPVDSKEMMLVITKEDVSNEKSETVDSQTPHTTLTHPPTLSLLIQNQPSLEPLSHTQISSNIPFPYSDHPPNTTLRTLKLNTEIAAEGNTEGEADEPKAEEPKTVRYAASQLSRGFYVKVTHITLINSSVLVSLASETWVRTGQSNLETLLNGVVYLRMPAICQNVNMEFHPCFSSFRQLMDNHTGLCILEFQLELIWLRKPPPLPPETMFIANVSDETSLDVTKALLLKRESAVIWKLSFIFIPNYETLDIKSLLKLQGSHVFCMIEKELKILLTWKVLSRNPRLSIFKLSSQSKGGNYEFLNKMKRNKTLGIGHAFSSFIWLCGPFIFAGSLMISLAVITIEFAVDIGYLLGDTKEHCSTFKGTRTRAALVFIIGLWMLGLANNTVQGPALADLSGPDQRNSANAIFCSWMAVGNTLGFSAGSTGEWHKWFPFLTSRACCEACGNLKVAFLIAVVFIDVLELPLIENQPHRLSDSAPLLDDPHQVGSDNSSTKHHPPHDGNLNVIKNKEDHEMNNNTMNHHHPEGEEQSDVYHDGPGAVLVNLLTTVRHLPPAIHSVFILSWFPFFLSDTDWMGREVYHGDPSGNAAEVKAYDHGVREGAFGLLLNSVVLGIRSFFIEPMCRQLGARLVWAMTNFTVFICMAGTTIISMISVREYSEGIQDLINGSGSIRIASLVVFAFSGFLLLLPTVSYFLAELTADSGGGHGLTIGPLKVGLRHQYLAILSSYCLELPVLVTEASLIMIPHNLIQFIGNLTYLVNKNVVPINRITVKRILRVKFMMGLFGNPMAYYSFADQLESQRGCQKVTCFTKEWEKRREAASTSGQECPENLGGWNSCRQLGLPMRWLEPRVARTRRQQPHCRNNHP
uniref:Uncharacterized protein n=1 Tax=Kalanchoe fedtschenkoi TaxID=63787 RepID=A0A7N1A3R9_KALFE